MAICGLRHPRHALGKVPGLKLAGLKVRHVLLNALKSRPHLLQGCVQAIGASNNDTPLGPSCQDIIDLREELLSALGRPLVPEPADDDVHTALFAPSWLSWALAANDPDVEVATWLTQGAPAGILYHATFTGIFPPVSGKEATCQQHINLAYYHEGYSN